MKHTKKLWALVLTLALVMSTLVLPAEVQAATAPKLSASKKTMYVGDTVTLKVKNQPGGATVTWSSGNKKAATVTKNGVVKAVKAGTANVTAKVKTKARVCKGENLYSDLQGNGQGNLNSG